MLFVTFLLLLLIFFIVFTFVCLITVFLSMFLLGFILPGTRCTSWNWVTVSFPLLEKLSAIKYYLSKYFLRSSLFLLSFWSLYNANVAAFNVVPEVS